MAQSKQSEEKIILLGKHLIEELKLEYTVNTFARWMVHYLAELIQQVEECNSLEEKRLLQKECCDIILKIWSKRDDLPIKRLMDDYTPIIEIMTALQNKKVSILPQWVEYRHLPRNNHWATFVDLVKNNSEKIFMSVISTNINKRLLTKSKVWLQKNKELLNSEEEDFLRYLETLSWSNKKTGVQDFNNYEPKYENLTLEERYKLIFEEMEQLLDEQKNELEKLKRKILK